MSNSNSLPNHHALLHGLNRDAYECRGMVLNSPLHQANPICRTELPPSMCRRINNLGWTALNSVDTIHKPPLGGMYTLLNLHREYP